jgi:ribonuclease BN (tRNA processing enzyme)
MPGKSAPIDHRLDRRSLLAATSAIACVALLPASAAFASEPTAAGKLILLGTQGGPNFSLTRGETASALIVGDRLYLVDCGYGALHAMARAKLDFRSLNAIFLTHLHDDHTSDLVPILTHLATQGRLHDLVVYGPPGTQALVTAALATLKPSADIRVADEERPDGFLSFIKAVEARPGAPFLEDGAIRVSCAENSHYPKDNGALGGHGSFAYRFDWGRSVVFSGDTTYSDELVRLARDADVFVCEVLEPRAMRTAFERMVAAGAFGAGADGVWRHMLATHSTPEQVGRMAVLARVRQVVLNHLAPGSLIELPESLFKEGVGQAYRGPVTVGHDGMVIPI